MIIIESPDQLLPGDLMFGPIPGAGGVAVGFAQLFLSIAEPVVAFSNPHEWFKYRHTGMVVESQSNGPFYKPARLVQAEPGGAVEVDVDDQLWNDKFLYIRPKYSMFPSDQGTDCALAARGYVDTPYDFETYGAIPLYRRGLHTKRIKQIISGTDTMMCSRLVDAALADGGWHLFTDHRLPGNVTPSEVLQRTRQLAYIAQSDIK